MVGGPFVHRIEKGLMPLESYREKRKQARDLVLWGVRQNLRGENLHG